jgi:hypothetical protein
MKYISTVILLAVIFWSWTAVNAPSAVPLVTHVGLQDNLKEIIKTKIHDMLPNANQIVFSQMETRTLTDTQVEATFSYSYKEKSAGTEPGVKTTLSGRAILNQHAVPAPDKNEPVEYSWSFDKLEMNGQVIDFDDDTPATTTK